MLSFVATLLFGLISRVRLSTAATSAISVSLSSTPNYVEFNLEFFTRSDNPAFGEFPPFLYAADTTDTPYCNYANLYNDDGLSISDSTAFTVSCIDDMITVNIYDCGDGVPCTDTSCIGTPESFFNKEDYIAASFCDSTNAVMNIVTAIETARYNGCEDSNPLRAVIGFRAITGQCTTIENKDNQFINLGCTSSSSATIDKAVYDTNAYCKSSTNPIITAVAVDGECYQQETSTIYASTTSIECIQEVLDTSEGIIVDIAGDAPAFELSGSDAEFIILPDPPSFEPTKSPTPSPSNNPTKSPITRAPTQNGETLSPTLEPTFMPTEQPIISTDNTDIVGNANGNNKGSKQTSNGNIMSLPILPVQGTCLVVNVGLFMSLLYYLFINKKSKNKIITLFKVPVIMTFICNIIGILCVMMISYLMFSSVWTKDIYKLAIYPYIGAAIMYSLGKFFLESFFLIRLYNSFAKSAYQYNKCIYVGLFVWMISISLMWIYLFIFGSFYEGYLFLALLEGLLSFTLLYLFANRLSKLVKAQKKMDIELSSSSRPSSRTATSSMISNTNTKPRHHESVASVQSLSSPNYPKPRWHMSIASTSEAIPSPTSGAIEEYEEYDTHYDINNDSFVVGELDNGFTVGAPPPPPPEALPPFMSNGLPKASAYDYDDEADDVVSTQPIDIDETCSGLPTLNESDYDSMYYVDPWDEPNGFGQIEEEYNQILKKRGIRSKSRAIIANGITKLKSSAAIRSMSVADIKMIKNKLNDKQTKLIFLITRCMLLSFIATVTTTIFGLLIFDYDSLGDHYYLVFGVWCIDFCINSICLYLNFAFTTRVYTLCCNKLHKCCQNIVELQTAKSILNEHIKEESSKEQVELSEI